jgi:hypothetical protein
VITEKSLCQTFLEVRDSQDDNEYSYVAIEKTRPGYFMVKIFEDAVIGKGETKEVIKVRTNKLWLSILTSRRCLLPKRMIPSIFSLPSGYIKGSNNDEDEEEANIWLCREEMRRTQVAKQITTTFCKMAHEKNVAIHGM